MTVASGEFFWLLSTRMTNFPLLENVTFKRIKDLQLGKEKIKKLQYYERDFSESHRHRNTGFQTTSKQMGKYH